MAQSAVQLTDRIENLKRQVERRSRASFGSVDAIGARGQQSRPSAAFGRGR